jgi:hypothetical protein
VYRSEEWDRVVLHEMIHALEWDWQMPTKPFPCWGLESESDLFPALFEAWTELLAEWLWCVWHNVSWETQRAWQDKQAVQVLVRQKGPWKENTSVFAYYVLKSTLAPNFAFLWIHGNGDNVLCDLVQPELTRLRSLAKAKTTTPETISLRMSLPR